MSRRTTRPVCALVLAGAAVPLIGVAPAQAAVVDEAASSAGYFSLVGPQDTGTPAGTPRERRDLRRRRRGREPRRCRVAAARSRRCSFLLFPGDALEPGATVSSATLTVPLAEGSGNVSAAAAPEKVRACAIDDAGFGGEDGASLAVAPRPPVRRLQRARARPRPTRSPTSSTSRSSPKLWTEENDGLAAHRRRGRRHHRLPGRLPAADQATPQLRRHRPGRRRPPRLAPDAAAADGGPPPPRRRRQRAPPTSPAASAPARTSRGRRRLRRRRRPARRRRWTRARSTPDPGLVEAAPAAAPRRSPAGSATAPRPQRAESLTPGRRFWLGLGLLGALLALVSLVLGDGEVPHAATSTSRL